MNIIDRLLLIRRAFAIAIDPKTENVDIKVHCKNGAVYGRVIFTDYEKAKKAYEDNVMQMFSGGAETADQLARRVTGFSKMIQDDWNLKNPNDRASFIQEKESSE